MEGRVGDIVEPDRRHDIRWGRYASAIARWEHIVDREAPAPALLSGALGFRPAPSFVEWLMGLEAGWVTESVSQITPNQQLTSLGNGVLPLQAVRALRLLGTHDRWICQNDYGLSLLEAQHLSTMDTERLPYRYHCAPRP